MVTSRDTETQKKAATRRKAAAPRWGDTDKAAIRRKVALAVAAQKLSSGGPSGGATTPKGLEAEASMILERVERELPGVEKRTERLMHRYSL
jgi:predicted phage gp36 major capsid-like protein